LVGEFLEGKELAQHLDEVGKMPLPSAVRIVRQICKALTAAHEKGVVHRDVKPENVFLTGDPMAPIAKVIDFGISRIDSTGSTTLTRTGMIMGTPSYMAPEQARGERVDHRADIYSVGAILYCALTGQRPFDGSDPTAVLTAVLTRDPPRPCSLDPSIPEAVEMIIQRAMAKEAQDRYQSMAELDADLAPYDVDSPHVPAPRVSTAQGWPSERRSVASTRQARTVAMARPMVVLLGGVGIFWAMGSLMMAVTAAVRITRGSGAKANLTLAETVFLVVGFAFTLLTPVILAARHVRRSVWNNTVKAVDLADQLRGPVVVGLSAYGFASLLIRLIEAVVLRHAVGIAWPYWDLALLGIVTIAAVGARLLDLSETRR
jgi:serine/threonine-protein kinase